MMVNKSIEMSVHSSKEGELFREHYFKSLHQKSNEDLRSISKFKGVNPMDRSEIKLPPIIIN